MNQLLGRVFPEEIAALTLPRITPRLWGWQPVGRPEAVAVRSPAPVDDTPRPARATGLRLRHRPSSAWDQSSVRVPRLPGARSRTSGARHRAPLHGTGRLVHVPEVPIHATDTLCLRPNVRYTRPNLGCASPSLRCTAPDVWCTSRSSDPRHRHSVPTPERSVHAPEPRARVTELRCAAPDVWCTPSFTKKIPLFPSPRAREHGGCQEEGFAGTGRWRP